jgi:hypothetical protein
VSELIECVLKELKYADHLQKNYSDWESRWENVRELITFATDVVSGSTNMGEAADTEGEPGVFSGQENVQRDEAVAASVSQAVEQDTAKNDTSRPVIDLTEDEFDGEVLPDQAEVYVKPCSRVHELTSYSVSPLCDFFCRTPHSLRMRWLKMRNQSQR